MFKGPVRRDVEVGMCKQSLNQMKSRVSEGLTVKCGRRARARVWVSYALST